MQTRVSTVGVDGLPQQRVLNVGVDGLPSHWEQVHLAASVLQHLTLGGMEVVSPRVAHEWCVGWPGSCQYLVA